MLEEMKESVLRRLFYHAVPSPEEIIKHIEEERRRHAELEKQMQLTHGDEVGGASEEESTGDKSLDDERARLESQKKARRKAAKR
jgi:hypothetical protein